MVSISSIACSASWLHSVSFLFCPTPESSAVPDPVTLRVEKLIPGGKGFARLPDGRIALLQAVVPDDEIEVIQARQRKGYLEVTDWRLLKPSIERVEPPCQVATSCGGCDWMMLSGTAQDAAKIALLREALVRTGKIAQLPNPIELVKGPQALGYRSRIRLQVSTQGRIGFYSAASHDLVEVPGCAVAAPEIDIALQRLRDLAHLHPEALQDIQHVEIRSASDHSISLHFSRSVPGKPRPPTRAALLTELRRHFIVCIDDDAQDPATWQRYSVHENIELKAPPGTFTQINWQVNQLLIAQVVQGALTRNVESFADLYCGSGNFTLPLLARGMRGVGVEANPLSIKALRAAANEQNLPSLGLLCMDAAQYAAAAALRGERYDLVLVDPPRAGIKLGLSDIAQLATRYLAICSCDPVTLARDLRALIDLGFELELVTAFDMFPQTHHVEALAWLRRTERIS